MVSVSDYSALSTAVSSSGSIDFTSNIVLQASLSISGVEINLNGNQYALDGASTYRCFSVTGTTTLNLNNITVQHCFAPIGAGIYITGDSSNLILSHSNFSHNIAQNTADSSGYGGALGTTNGITTIKSCIFSNNTVTQSSNRGGGAIGIDGGIVYLYSSDFLNNNGPNSGALWFDRGTFIASNLKVNNNIDTDAMTINDIGGNNFESAVCTSGCSAGKYGNCSDATAYLGSDVVTGDDVTCFVNCECTDCPAGKYLSTSESTSPSDCLSCGTGQISEAGASSCTSCAVGKYATDTSSDTGGGLTSQVTTEATYCNDCPGGTIAGSTSTIVCTLCDGGKYTTGGSSSCDDCSTGKYSSNGEDGCTDCPAGKFNQVTASSTCDECSGDTYSTVGSTSCDLCLRNFYYADDGECKDCPHGVSCEGDGNSTQSLLKIDKNYWRVAEKSVDILSCPIDGACLGGRSFTDDGDGYCEEGYEGPLCAVCSKDYYFNADDLACLSCDNRGGGDIQSNFTIVIFALVCAFFILVGILKCLLSSPKYKDKSKLIEIASSKLPKELKDSEPINTQANKSDSDQESSDTIKMKKILKYDSEPTSQSMTQTLVTPIASVTTTTIINTKSSVKTELLTTIKTSSRGYAIGSSLNDIQVKFKLLLAFLQIAINISFNCDIIFPDIFQYLLDCIVIVNLDILPSFGINCMFGTYDYIHKMVVITIVPLVVSLILGIIYIFCKLFLSSNSSLKKSTVTAFLLLTFLVLINTSTTLFHYHKCDVFDLPSEEGGGSVSYMFKDYSIDCDSDRYKSYKLYSYIMIIVYPIGIPSIYYLLLHFQKSVVKNEDGKLNEDISMGSPKTGHLTFLIKSYKPEYYYFEIVECIRRLLLASVIGVITSDEDTAFSAIFGILISLVFNWMFINFKPYKNKNDNVLSIVLSYSLTLFFFAALMIKAGANGDDKDDQFTFSVILIIILLLGPIVIISLQIKDYCCCCFKKKEIENSNSSEI